MEKDELIRIFKCGSKVWNSFRSEVEMDVSVKLEFADIDFEKDVHNYKHLYDMPYFQGYNLSHLNMNRSSMRNSVFFECDFSYTDMHFSDLCFSEFLNCDFTDTGIQVSKIGSAKFENCIFNNANLSYCSAEETSFKKSKIINTDLSNMSLVNTDFSYSKIIGSNVYGISAWDLKLKRTKQEDLIVRHKLSKSYITVDNIEFAQLIYLLMNNKKLRNVIDSITSKAVLILGRFTIERKNILNKIKSALRKKGYLPILFDFDNPSNRDVHETVSTIAHLSRFIIADITDPKSIPQELTAIIPNIPSVPLIPIIENDQREYGMFNHFKKYPWVLELYRYVDICNDLDQIIEACEHKLTDEKSQHAI